MPSDPNPTGIRIPAQMALGVYALLALAQTWPLALHPASRLPAGPIDVWSSHWNFWWWRHCLWGFRSNPYHSDLLCFPAGTDVIFHTHSIFNMVVSAPVNLLFGEAAAYNFCVLLAVTTAGFFAFLLARDVTGHDYAAMLAGLIYAFVPQRLEYAMEFLNLLSSQFIPLTLLFFRRVALRGGRGSAIGLGVAYAFNALCDWHLGLELTLLLIAAALGYLWKRPRPVALMIRDWGLAAALAAMILLPFVYPMIQTMLTGDPYFQKRQAQKGVDLAFLLFPHHHHPVFGRWIAGAYWNILRFGAAGSGCFLGYTPILLGVMAVLRSVEKSSKWLLVFGTSLLLAMGSQPHMMGRVIAEVSLPFATFEHLPVLGMLRVANRFFVPASLAWGILAAIGGVAVLRDSKWKWGVVCALVLFEFAWAPFTTQPLPALEGYRRIGGDATPGAVLDLPFTDSHREAFNLTGQTAHQRPIAGGYLSTMDHESFRFHRMDPVLSDLRGLDPPLRKPIDLDHLRAMGFGFVVLHRDRTTGLARIPEPPRGEHDLYRIRIAGNRNGLPAEKWRRLHEELSAKAGPPFHEDDDITVFKIR